MLAIATLVHDDPYLKLSPSQRLAEHHARRARLFPQPADSARDLSPTSAADVVNVPETEEQWAERQKQMHSAIKPPWFYIVDEIDPPRQPCIQDMQRVVCRHFKVSRADMLSPRRNMHTVRARQVAMYVAKTLTMRSLPEIGRRFGGRDHTTVLHAVRKITRLIDTELGLLEQIDGIISELGSGA